VAALIGGDPAGIVFTGSGSEADNLAIRGTVLASPDRRRHVITQATKHPALLATCRALHRPHGVEVTVLPVDRHGLADPDDLQAAITPHTTIVSIHAGQQRGRHHPADRRTRRHRPRPRRAAAHRRRPSRRQDPHRCRRARRRPAHPGRAQDVRAQRHRRPLRAGLTLEPVVYGDGQEHGLRAGTENVAYAVALGAAADLAHASLDTNQPRLTGLRDRLHRTLDTALPGAVHLSGHPDRRLPNTLNIAITGVTGNDLLAAVPQLAASTGSACHSGTTEPSPFLTAMGLDRDRALGAVRLSLGRWTTTADVDRAADLFATAAHRRRTQPAGTTDTR